MSNDLICPKCGAAFRDEDYCPRDGARLVPPSAASGLEASPADVDATIDETLITQAAQAAEDGPEQERESKLARFFDRFKLRPVADKAALGLDTPQSISKPSLEPSSPLPEVVTEKGWRLAGLVQSSASVDHWPVERPTDSSTPVAGHFHRFRTGALTTDAIYRRLEDTTTVGLARVWAHGTADVSGARADYELVSLPKTGVGLDKWLVGSTPSEQRAWNLLPALVQLLRQLEQAGVHPMAFEPSQLLFTDDGELWLASAGTLADVASADSFHPEFARSALLPRDWTAPELTQQSMLSANAAVFSLGQVLAQATWGQPCSISELQNGAVSFQSLADPRLARVLMGCLWPRRSTERWTYADLFKAVDSMSVDAMPDTAPWASLAPGASSTSFSLFGASFWRLEDLLAGAARPSHWREATTRIEAILDWAESTSWVGQVKLMREALAQGRSADWVLVALTRVVRPEAPMAWRELDLSDAEAAQSLAGLAQRVLHGRSTTDVAAMRELFKADLRGAFAHVPPKS
jgi:hypothetical protein